MHILMNFLKVYTCDCLINLKCLLFVKVYIILQIRYITNNDNTTKTNGLYPIQQMYEGTPRKSSTTKSDI
jgi:hypothetical protein